jgi:hypothetical protein
MSMTVKFKPKSGAEFEVPNVTSVDWDAHRMPAPNGQVGQRNHNLGMVRLVRRKSLQQAGKVKNETEIVKLAAAVETKAYFEGTITITSSDDSAATVQTIRWDQGHICDIGTSSSEHGVQETLGIAVTNLKVDDVEFKVVPTT